MAVIEGSTVLVTGGCGFIGVNLAKLLKPLGCRILAFDNFSSGHRQDGEAAGYQVIEGDIREAGALSSAVEGVDHLIHLAAHTNVVESVADPEIDVEVNVMGTLNVLSAARAAGVRSVVFASSNAPLGEIDPPSHEGRVPNPVSPYGASKLAGEALCSAFAGSYGLQVCSLRFSNVYGPFSYHKGSVVATFMRDVMGSTPLTVYGDGRQTRDFIYVGDLVKGIVSSLESSLSGEVIHLGTGVETSINELVDMFRSTFPDMNIEAVHKPPRAGEIDRNYSDIAKARRTLGFDPSTSLVDGLGLTRAWFEDNALV